jgi:NADPH-dependent 2,4-dienoyl-CoA reductase/sulfur reductase-like enzyme
VTERLVVIGGDAGGMGTATQARRLRPDLEIVALEKSPFISYSACGIPYVVGGSVDDLDKLVVRTPQQFADQSNIEVRIRHEVMGIDLDARQVEVRDLEGERTYRLDFDMLQIATGAAPIRPELPGIDSDVVHGVQTLHDAAHLLEHAEAHDVGNVVVVGAGYIGLEMAEAFIERGSPSVTVIEAGPEVMPTLDPDMASLVSKALRDKGVVVELERRVTGFEPSRVTTDKGDVPADLIILGIGVTPNSALATDAGLTTGAKGAIKVDRRQRTSADGVFAAGDCCESFHRIANEQVHIALGTVANKQARVAGINIGGGYATFDGVVGTAVTKICATEVGRTGLSEREAKRYGFSAVAATVDSATRAGYFPGKRWITVKLVAERRTGRLLGGQIVGLEGAAKRIDVLATAVTAGFTVEQIIGLDLSYAPPFGPVWDPVQAAARKVAGVLAGGSDAQ